MSDDNPSTFSENPLSVIDCAASDETSTPPYNEDFKLLFNSDNQKLSIFSSALEEIRLRKANKTSYEHDSTWEQRIKNKAIERIQTDHSHLYWPILSNRSWWKDADVYRRAAFEDLSTKVNDTLDSSKQERVATILRNNGNRFMPIPTNEAGSYDVQGYTVQPISLFDEDARVVSSWTMSRVFVYSDPFCSWISGDTIENVRNGTFTRQTALEEHPAVRPDGMTFAQFKNILYNHLADKGHLNANTSWEQLIGRPMISFPLAYYEHSKKQARAFGITEELD